MFKLQNNNKQSNFWIDDYAGAMYWDPERDGIMVRTEMRCDLAQKFQARKQKKNCRQSSNSYSLLLIPEKGPVDLLPMVF